MIVAPIPDRLRRELADAGVPLSHADLRARLGRWNLELVRRVAAAIKRPTVKAHVSGELALWIVRKYCLPRAEDLWAEVASYGERSARDGIASIFVLLTGDELRRLVWRLPLLEESPRSRRRART